MACDDELEQLVTFVHDHFGEAELSRAMDRAKTSAARRQSSSLADLLGDDGKVSALGSVIQMDAYCEALRGELRKLARPH